MSEEEATKLGYILDQGNHDHVKDISIKVQRPHNIFKRNPDDFVDTPRTGSMTPNTQTEIKKVPANAMTPNVFGQYFWNFTNPDWEWKDWSKEGVLMAAQTDKPVYRPGDEVQVRVYYFNYTSKAPLTKCENFYPN